ncbi:MAG: hypothetical protein QG559_694 [Campylobacterota bacterium]|jgi:hypothetical protein|nr:hypothetical protein [Campylobacterota bacterium]
MKEIIKRYGMALFLLFLVSALMVLGTMGVKKMGDKMFEDTGVEMKPRGENIVK